MSQAIFRYSVISLRPTSRNYTGCEKAYVGILYVSFNVASLTSTFFTSAIFNSQGHYELRRMALVSMHPRIHRFLSFVVY